MAKAIIIPEPHISYNNLEGRKNYQEEIKSYMSKVLRIIQNDEHITDVVFVGDIFNRGFKKIEEYFYWTDWFNYLQSFILERGGRLYSAIGNHELSFSENNPFWRLVSLGDNGYSTKMEYPYRDCTPKGLRSVFNVPDVLEYGDVTFFFCHYNGIELCKNNLKEHIEKYGDLKKRVCISHNSIISSEIANVLRENYGRDPLTAFIEHEQIKSLDFFQLFDFVFNGHMHKAYSNFTITNEDNNHKTYLYYLGSLGRTNSAEINDNDLIRRLPTITDTGEYGEYTLELLNRQETLIEKYDSEKEKERFTEVAYKEICNKIVDVKNPVDDILDAITDIDMVNALNSAREGAYSSYFYELLDKVNKVVM